MLQQAKTFRITHEDLAQNMREFVGQCVAYDAIMGRKYTIDELRHSEDIWGLVSKNASPIRSFLWKDLSAERAQTRPQILSCKEGAEKLNQAWGAEINRASTLFGKKIFGKNGLVNPSKQLKEHLKSSYEMLTDMSQQAEDILKQNMMIYAVVGGLEQKSVSVGNAPNFAVRRAYLQQRATYETLGAMASETLPTMKAVLEAIAYCAFMFVIPLAVLPFGWRFLTSWVQTLLWLQMWAPLYAVLNYIMTMAARSKSLSALAISNEAGITIANSVGLVNVNADIAAMAGYLAMSIPFLCIALIKGVGSFVHLASHLGNVGQGAAAQAASEMTSGNYSFGNVTQGNRQISNTCMLNQSYTASYRSGSFHQGDGRSDYITTADGQQIVNVSSSNLPISLNVAETQSAQLSQQASLSYHKGMQQTESYARSMANTLRQGVDLFEHVGSAQQSSDQYNQLLSTEEQEALNKSAQIVNDFAKENNLTTTQASSILASASIGGSKGLSIMGMLGINAQVSGNIRGEAHLQDVYRRAEKIAQSEDFQTALRQTSQLSKSQSFNHMSDEGKRLSENMNRAWDEANSFREDANKSFRQSEDYQNQANFVRSSAASINANVTQDFIDWMSLQKADNTPGVLGKQGASQIIANNPVLRQSYAERFLEENNYIPKRSGMIDALSPENLRSHYQVENAHNIAPVNKALALKEITAFGQDAKTNQFNPIDNKSLSETFEAKQGEVQQQLMGGSERSSQAYRNAEFKHNVQAKRNLTGLAIGQEVKHAEDLVDAISDKIMGERQSE